MEICAIIFVLPCFMKILGEMHDWLFRYLAESNIFQSKQSVFQKKHATEHVIIQSFDRADNSAPLKKIKFV